MQQEPPASTSRRKARRSSAIGLSRASSNLSTRRTAGADAANEEMEVEMDDNEKEKEGMSTGKKVVAGAAVGVAVPAAVGVAKKLLGNGDDEQDKGSGQVDRSRQTGRKSASSGRGRSSQ